MSRKSSRPKILKALTVWFDVDDTLILWDVPNEYIGPAISIAAHNTYAGYAAGPVFIQRRLAINIAMVQKLREHKRSGHNVVVWSQGGVEWAAAVVHELGLDRFVDVIADKPTIIYDDLHPTLWMPAPRHVLPEGWPSVHSHLNLQVEYMCDDPDSK